MNPRGKDKTPKARKKKDAAKEVRNKHDYRSFDCNTVYELKSLPFDEATYVSKQTKTYTKWFNFIFL